MLTSFNRRSLAVSIPRKLLLNFFLILLIAVSNKLAYSTRYNSLINQTRFNIKRNSLTTLAMASESNNPSTPLREDDLEGDLTFHDIPFNVNDNKLQLLILIQQTIPYHLNYCQQILLPHLYCYLPIPFILSWRLKLLLLEV
jgi:hypothetical protein